MRPNPLQWACFKANIEIVWLLLKKGLSLYLRDSLGNNSIHLAASSGNLTVFFFSFLKLKKIKYVFISYLNHC